MSGFLDRMGARAADGSRPEVTNRLVTSSAPRVPALFESAPIDAITPEPAPPVSAVEGRPALPDAEVRPVPPDRDPAQVRVERELVPVPAPAEPSPLPAPAARHSQPAERQSKPAARQSQPAARQSQPAARQSQPAARQSQPAALVVPAAPVALAPAAPAGARNESSAAAQRGPDVIRVSIGRVDVRAPAAPPRQAPPVPVPAAKADRLSLQDYLRGQRGTR
jgi:hypothetical protein